MFFIKEFHCYVTQMSVYFQAPFYDATGNRAGKNCLGLGKVLPPHLGELWDTGGTPGCYAYVWARDGKNTIMINMYVCHKREVGSMQRNSLVILEFKTKEL